MFSSCGLLIKDQTTSGITGLRDSTFFNSRCVLPNHFMSVYSGVEQFA